jgi:glucose/arabinose dehydrogenase
VRAGPDGLLYVAQGSTCNVCTEQDDRRATMMRFQPDGSGGEIYATGLRNSVGFDWAPWSGDLYATDNGRDMLGDDFPPCELNLIEQGSFYGWPYFNGANLPDPDMGADPLADQRKPTSPVHGFRPHNAPLGITFIDSTGWPDGYERIALAALHGSWNRSSPDGYKVVSLHWTDSGIEERDFLTGFNRDGDIAGRPVDVAQGPDGAIYISDDYAGAIYRVSYGESSAVWSPANAAASSSRLDTQTPAWLSAVLNCMDSTAVAAATRRARTRNC